MIDLRRTVPMRLGDFSWCVGGCNLDESRAFSLLGDPRTYHLPDWVDETSIQFYRSSDRRFQIRHEDQFVFLKPKGWKLWFLLLPVKM